ncbi:MAG: hypothetical protein ISR55_05390 [Bacteroidetes bacterium]|nr:hypothetical protein [Bacteroidota bacterium]
MTLLDISQPNVYQLIKHFHSIISIVFLVAAVWLIYRSIAGIRKNLKYTSLDKVLSFIFIANMYLQLIFGLVLFTNFGSAQGYDYIGAGTNEMIVSKRLWPIEHIVLMIFALFIANLGLISSIKTSIDKDKHSKVLIFYSMSILLILISLGVIYIF